MIRRTIVLLVLALAALALVRLDDPHATPAATPSPIVGPSTSDAGISTWFCPAAAASADGPAHQVIVTSLAREVTARVTAFSTAGGAPVTQTVTVPADSQHVVSMSDLGSGLGGATVEVDGGPATVAHRLAASDRSDQSACLTEAGPRWYFTAANTERDFPRNADASAQLWLLNPFPTDASVDIRVSTDDLVRVPPALRGLIVPAGSSRMVDLGQSVQRREQFALSVEARGGRIAAELAQSVPGQGLRLTPGVPDAAMTWMFADSFGGENLSDRVIVFNPSSRDTTVLVSVVPNGLDALAMPEPFEQEIGGRRFAVVDLTAEARIPPEGLRWIRVDALEGTGVVATQLMGIMGAGGSGSADTRPTVPGGLAALVGATAQARSWTIPSVDATPDSQSVVVVANPSPDSISLVTLTSISGGTTSVIADDLEVPPAASLAVDVSAATAGGPIGVRVDASTPVVVSARTTSVSRSELGLLDGVPDASTASPIPELGGA